MRAILIDWIIEVLNQFNLKTESMFLTINLIDRYLEKVQVNKDILQLVGVSAMLIACKYEEIYPPQIRDYIYMCDKCYNREQIITMELSMLAELDFNIDFVSHNTFLDRFQQMISIDDTVRHMAQYLIEISLQDYSLNHLNPSFLTIGAVYQACNLLRVQEPGVDKLISSHGYKLKQIQQVGAELQKLLKDYQKNKLEGIKKKYSTKQYSQISLYQFDFSQTDMLSSSKLSSNMKSLSDNKTSRDANTTDKKKNISADKVIIMTT